MDEPTHRTAMLRASVNVEGRTDALAAESTPPRTIHARATVAHLTGKGVTVAVIDSGYDRSQQDPRVLPGVGLVDGEDGLRLRLSDDDADRNGHGTACAQLILDIAPGCTVYPIRIFGRRLETGPHVLACAIAWAQERGLKLLNLSLGTDREDALRYLYAACERARRAGMIVVAAGRLGADGWSYPAVFDPVIGVGAAPLDDPFEIQYSPNDALECRARTRGRRVRGLRGREYRSFGTSFATPVVTALIARWLEQEPALDLEGVRRKLASTSRA